VIAEATKNVVSVWISGAAEAILSLDSTAADRGLQCVETKRHRIRRGWASRVLVRGSREAIESIATELNDVAAGLLCDDTDDPAATKRAAREGAAQIRKQLGGAA
jgi:hypothetical protein